MSTKGEIMLEKKTYEIEIDESITGKQRPRTVSYTHLEELRRKRRRRSLRSFSLCNFECT